MSQSTNGHPRITINPDSLERLAAELPTQLAVAAELEISQPTLVARLLDTPDLARAWERGRSAYEKAKAEKRLAPVTRRRPSPPPTPRAPEPEPEPVPKPEPPRFTGTRQERVLAALKAAGSGGRTFGELMHDTRLDWPQVVDTVNSLARNRQVVARDVCGTRRHFVAGDTVASAG